MLLATFKRETVASYLFGKPPNPRRGTSWKRRQTSPLYTYFAITGFLSEGSVVREKGRNDE